MLCGQQACLAFIFISPRKISLDSGINSGLYNAWVFKMTEKTNYRSGELARLAGVSTDTLRHYERKGVLPAPQRSANGYRVYPSQALERVRLVRRALGVGFTLDELARILKEHAKGGAPCRQVRELAAGKLAEVETRLSELIILRDELRATLSDWDGRLAKTDAGQRAGLLEALAQTSTEHPQLSTAKASWSRRKH
jgi:MerR family transcriptional regulator, copper efflux regulator